MPLGQEESQVLTDELERLVEIGTISKPYAARVVKFWTSKSVGPTKKIGHSTVANTVFLDFEAQADSPASGADDEAGAGRPGGSAVASVQVVSQGIDENFAFTGEYGAVELGAVTASAAVELVKRLPEIEAVPEGWCPPALHFSYDRPVPGKKMKIDSFHLNVSVRSDGDFIVFRPDGRDEEIVDQNKALDYTREYFDEAANEPLLRSE
jgi:hypothetical protein